MSPGSAAALSAVLISSNAACVAVSVVGFELLVGMPLAPPLAVFVMTFVCPLLGMLLVIYVLIKTRDNKRLLRLDHKKIDVIGRHQAIVGVYISI